MLITYFLGGTIDMKKCKFRIENTISEFSELPDNVEFIISMKTKLKANADTVKQALTEEGYPKCKVKPDGTIMWYSKKKSPSLKFRLPEFTDVEKTTSIVGFAKEFPQILSHPFDKAVGKVRIESSHEIDFEEPSIDGKNRIFPSVSFKKMLKVSKINQVEFKGETVLDFKNKNYKNIFDVINNITPVKELLVSLKPLISNLYSLKVITPQFSISINYHPGIDLTIFPKYLVRKDIKIVPLLFDNITELIEMTTP